MEGKRAVITDFIYKNQASMYRLAFAYTHSREAALDIVQDTVVQALTHLDDQRPQCSRPRSRRFPCDRTW